MDTEKFKDLFLFGPKSKIKAGDGLKKGRFPFYTSSPKLSKWIDIEQYYDEAIIFGTGGSASVHYEDKPFSTSTDCFVAIARTNKSFNLKFVYYYIFKNIRILEQGFKGAGLKHISKTYIQNLDIPLFDLETQDKIVAILDKAQSLIEKRDKTISILEEFLFANFLETFGKNNPEFKYWEDIEIGSLKKCEKGSMRTGPFGSSLKHDRFKDEGEVAVLGIDNAVDNIFKWKQKRYLSLSEFDEFKRYQVYPRDIIITIMGTVGRSAVIPENIGLAINTKHLAALTIDESKCNPYYLAYSIHSNPYIKYQLKSKARGAVMDGFNLTLIKELKIKNAPLNLQNQFEKLYLKCIDNTEKLKLSKSKFEDLINALSQLAFTGKLEFNTAVDLEVLLENDYTYFKDNADKKAIQLLLERLDKNELNLNKFHDKDIYDKAKSFVFELLKQGHIKQVLDKKTNKVKLTM